MALSIGVTKGSEIQIDDQLLRVMDAANPFQIDVTIGGQTFRLTENRQEICPGVIAFCGRNLKSSNDPRIAFEAPRQIKINRKEPGVSQSQGIGPTAVSAASLTSSQISFELERPSWGPRIGSPLSCTI